MLNNGRQNWDNLYSYDGRTGIIFKMCVIRSGETYEMSFNWQFYKNSVLYTSELAFDSILDGPSQLVYLIRSIFWQLTSE